TKTCPDSEGRGRPAERLVWIIASTVAPKSWAEMGGSATIQYFAPSKAIVVTQTADRHEQIEDVLAALGRRHEEEMVRRAAPDPGRSSGPKSTTSGRPAAPRPPSVGPGRVWSSAP